MGMKRGIIVWMLVFAAGIAAAGCGNGGENEEIRESLTESGYEDENREIYFYDAEDKKQTLFFGARGDGCIYWQEEGHDSDNCFRIGSRNASWEGVSLDLADKDVIGKRLHVSFWTRHAVEGEAFSIGCTLQVRKPDMVTEDWPESLWSEPIPAGEWVHVEGEIPVYTDAVLPQLNFEATGTYEFMLDDIQVTVDDDSITGTKYGDSITNVEPFTGISLDFEDGEVYFTNRGDGVGWLRKMGMRVPGHCW